MKEKFINERQIWLVDLEPTKGIEIRKIRPCLVIRKFSKNHLVILPLTTSGKHQHAHPINAKFLNKKSFIKIDQIKTVDTIRFKKLLGMIPHKKFLTIKKISVEVLQLLPWGATAQNESAENLPQRANAQNSA